MSATYTPIASITLGANTASVTFNSIPTTYTDLVLVVNAGDTPTATLMRAQFNNDTANNYSETKLVGNGTSATSSRITTNSELNVGETAYMSTTNTGNAVYTLHFMNYANTTTNKTILYRASNANFGTELCVGLYRSTSAITSIKLFPPGNSFLTNSTFNLYGILGANA
jgi:hypothetical protein